MEDLDEWEVLPEDGHLEIHDDHQGHHFFSRKYLSSSPSDSLFKNYFGLSSPKQLPNDDDNKLIVPVPIQLELPELPIPVPVPRDDDAEEKKIIVVGNSAETEEDLLSHQVVFFKKETEFVDMKLLDSPRSRGIKPPPQMVQFEEAPEPIKTSADEAERDDDDEQNSGNLMNKNSNNNNILKWSLTGIGAICSFGVATVCVLVLGGLTKNLNGTKTCNNSKQQRGQKLQFHIYAEDKRLKQVVHQANKLNEAMAAMRGVPFTRAHITFGGYCDSH